MQEDLSALDELLALPLDKEIQKRQKIGFCLLILLSILHTNKKCDVAMISPSFSGKLLSGAHSRPGLWKYCSIGCSSSEESIKLLLLVTGFVFVTKISGASWKRKHVVHVYGQIMKFAVEWTKACFAVYSTDRVGFLDNYVYLIRKCNWRT